MPRLKRRTLSALFIFGAPALVTWTVLCLFLLHSWATYGVYWGNGVVNQPRVLNDSARSERTANLSMSATLSLEVASQVLAPNSGPQPGPVADIDTPIVAALLPVTGISQEALARDVLALLQSPRSVHEIVLLCPSAAARAVRASLHKLLPDEATSNTDVSIYDWPLGLEEGPAILRAARHIPADRLLIFDSAGLSDVSDDTLDMLLRSFVTPLPVGPKGFVEDGNRTICLPANDTPIAASFLVPPFSISTLLVPPHDLASSPVYDVWAALGNHIARARFEHVGGVIVQRGLAKTPWCTNKLAGSSTISTQSGVSATTTDEDLNLAEDGKEQIIGATIPNILVVFATAEQFRSFSPALCRMIQLGWQYQALLASDDSTAADGEQQLLSFTNCTLQITATSGTSLAAVATNKHMLDVVIASSFAGRISRTFDTILQLWNITATTVVIPETDLPYCDWMGSLNVQEWRNWYRPRLDVTVITDDRPHSLDRLLKSLQAARFFGDTVDLRINIEQTATPETLHLVGNFQWQRGSLYVHRRVIHGGLLPAVVESWYPSSNHSYGLILEDDIEVSPLFYAWAKMALLRYRYGTRGDASAQLFGLSLYQQKNLELRPEGRHRFNARTTFASASLPDVRTPYLSQIPCSWGAIYFPEHWREFHDYLAVRLAGSHPALPPQGLVAPGVRSNKWTRSWKKYFIELAYLRGYVMLYPNYRDYLSFSTNHLEVGSHVREMAPDAYARKKQLFLLPLVPLPEGGSGGGEHDTGLLDLPGARMPPWHALPVLDLLGLLTTEDTLRTRGDTRRRELLPCVSLPQTHDARSLLCLGA